MLLLELSSGPRLPEVIQLLGFVPGRFLAFLWHGSLTLAVIPSFTSMFMHAGWLQLIGNMWTLFIFRDNVEDTLGQEPYLQARNPLNRRSKKRAEEGGTPSFLFPSRPWERY